MQALRVEIKDITRGKIKNHTTKMVEKKQAKNYLIKT